MIYVHGGGKSAAASPGGEIEQFVKAGLIVLAIDLRGMGETRYRGDESDDDFPVYFGDFDSAMTALHMGKSLVGMRMVDVIRGVDLLAARAEVDRTRIIGFGKDAGAVPLLYASAMDERIGKIALEGMLASYQTVINQRIHRQIFEQVVTGVLRSFDLPDLVAALAPRQVWIVNAVNALGQQIRTAETNKLYDDSFAAFRVAKADNALLITERNKSESVAKTYRRFIDQQ